MICNGESLSESSLQQFPISLIVAYLQFPTILQTVNFDINISHITSHTLIGTNLTVYYLIGYILIISFYILNQAQL